MASDEESQPEEEVTVGACPEPAEDWLFGAAASLVASPGSTTSGFAGARCRDSSGGGDTREV